MKGVVTYLHNKVSSPGEGGAAPKQVYRKGLRERGKKTGWIVVRVIVPQEFKAPTRVKERSSQALLPACPNVKKGTREE